MMDFLFFMLGVTGFLGAIFAGGLAIFDGHCEYRPLLFLLCACCCGAVYYVMTGDAPTADFTTSRAESEAREVECQRVKLVAEEDDVGRRQTLRLPAFLRSGGGVLQQVWHSDDRGTAIREDHTPNHSHRAELGGAMTPDHALEAAEELLFGHLPRYGEPGWRCYTSEERRMLMALARGLQRDSAATIFTGQAGSA